MELEDNTTDTTFAEATSETSTATFATLQNLPALSSTGNLTAPPKQDGEPAPGWKKNYTNLDQFSDPEITKAAIESIAKRCSTIERLSGEANKRLWQAVAESVVIFHLSDQKTIDVLCHNAGNKKTEQAR